MRDSFIMTKEQCSEALDDLLVKIAMSSYAVREGRELVKENEQAKNVPEFKIPPNEEKVIIAEIRKHKNRQNIKLVQKTTKYIFTRVAIVFLILAIGFSTTMTVSAEFRRAIYKLILTTSDIDTKIRIEHKYREFVDSGAYICENYEGSLFAPTKIPAGYSLTSISDNRGAYRVLYTNENGNTIIFHQLIASGEALMSVDTENAQRVENIMIGDSEAFLVVKASENGVMSYVAWRIGDYLFSLLLNDIDAEMLVDMAQNIRLMK